MAERSRQRSAQRAVQRASAATLWLPAVICCAAFSSEFVLPRGVSSGFLYVVAVLSCLRLGVTARLPVTVAAVATPLIVIGHWIAFSMGIAPSVSLLNRALGLMAIWLCAYLTAQKLTLELEIDRDLSERQRGEALLRASEAQLRLANERLSLIHEAAGIGAWDWDVNTGEMKWSERLKTLFGFNCSDEVSYDDYLERVHVEDRPRVRHAVRSALTHGARYGVEMRVVLASEDVRWIVSKGRALFDAQGRPTRMIGMALDITALKEAQESLLAANVRLEQAVQERTLELKRANEELETFVRNVAHDLRAPLRHISGFAAALLEDERGSLSAEGVSYLDRIAQSARRLEELIADLLAYARLSQNELKLERIEWAPVIDEALEILRDDLRERRAQVEVDTDLPSVLGNRTAVKQVLTNLLSNGVKFVRQGVQPRVVVSAHEDGALAGITIADNGIGIAPEHHDRIFKVFERLHSTREYPGTGLGLAIVRKAIERMDGRIGIASLPGSGSRFTVLLRRAPSSVGARTAQVGEQTR